MDIKTYINYILQAPSNEVISDLYFNEVQLLLLLNIEANSRGLPLYKDYSRNQHRVSLFDGENIDSLFYIENNPSNDYPELTLAGDINVESFAIFNNKPNRDLRLAEFNSGDYNYSTIKSTHLEVLLEHGVDISFGTGDFCIEFSFFTDSINYSTGWQTLLSLGHSLAYTNNQFTLEDLKSYIVIGSSVGFSIHLFESDLHFITSNYNVTVNLDPIQANTWYHICLQRTNGTLKAFINSQLTVTTVCDDAIQVVDIDEHNKRLFIGMSPLAYNRNYAPIYNTVDTSFSGGLSNLRITKASRYGSNFYTVSLPFPVNPISNKIDSDYEEVLYNLPFLYDYYDYSSYAKHFTNKHFLKGAPDFRAGYLVINGDNSYKLDTVPVNLNSDEWTIEFYLCKALSSFVSTELYGVSAFHGIPEYNEYAYKTYAEWLLNYNVDNIYSKGTVVTINLITLYSNDKPILKINFNFVLDDNQGTYISLKASEDGESWLEFATDQNFDWNQTISFSGTVPFYLPNDELKFYGSYSSSDMVSLPNLSNKVPGGFSSKPQHIAFSLYNNILYFLLDGVVEKSVSFPYTLYSTLNNTRLEINSDPFLPLVGKRIEDTVSSTLELAIKGIRITNLARYSFVAPNNVWVNNSQQPPALGTNTIPPARARVIEIAKDVDLPSVSTQEVSWTVYLSQPVDNLDLDDFSLTGIDGIANYSLSSLSKITEYSYSLIADTGENNGTLVPFFIDRNTVRYPESTDLISNYINELDVEGERYLINKTTPLPILTSGVSPYISTEFYVTLTFDSAIEIFDPSKIGISNGYLDSIQIIDETSHTYRLLIVPYTEGVVTVQCLEGCGITDGGLISQKSAALIRVYSKSFCILLTPLNLAYTRQDLSPAKLTLTDVIPNNSSYDNTVYPLGTNSSLNVNPIYEASGLVYENYDSVGSSIDVTTLDWTIEFYLRIDSTADNTSKKAHILSVVNAATGFSIMADDGELRMQRTVELDSNLLGSATLNDRDTEEFVEWDDVTFTQQEKFPHFAITKKDNIYRLYRNGIRQAIVESSSLIDITKGDLRIGYYPGRVDDVSYWISNIRFTLGAALYTAYEVNLPSLPFQIPIDITEETSLLNYISLYSNNPNPKLAKAGDTVFLVFSSIITISNPLVVTINGVECEYSLNTNNLYSANLLISSEDTDSNIEFSILVQEDNIPSKLFTTTTNNSSVVIDNSPLEASITSNESNMSKHTLQAFISFTEPVEGFSVNVLSLVNCKVSNLTKVSNSSNNSSYSFTITAISSGVYSVTLPESVVTDLAGNYNLASNVFSRTAVVPAYIPDPYYDNVLLLLQPSSNIQDSSSYGVNIVNNNVNVVNDITPIGSEYALRFNGLDSSLSFTLPSNLPGTIEYTIEFYIYFLSEVVFRLASPKALPASEVSPVSFVANWESVPEASSYRLDISRDSGFSSYLEGYHNLDTGNNTTYPIGGIEFSSAPKLKPSRAISPVGFLAEWNYNVNSDFFSYEVSLDENFESILYNYSGKTSSVPYAVIGDLEGVEFRENTELIEYDAGEIANLPYDPYRGVLMTGILTNSSYPRLFYFLEEATVRYYDTNNYTLPIIAEYMDSSEWFHIAITNKGKFTNLYVNGKLIDKVRNSSFNSSFDVGYSLGNFYGLLSGLRITKGVARYEDNFEIPQLPFPEG